MKRYISCYKLALVYCLPLCLLLMGCKKMVEVSPPRNQIVTSQVFVDSTNASAAVIAIYTKLMGYATSLTISNGAVTVFTGLSSDELYTTSGIPEETQFYVNAVSPETGSSNFLWSNAYQMLYQINACAEGLESSLINQSLKNHLLGECKFLRGFIYFNLVNLFGAVPYVHTTDYKVNSTLPRLEIDSVYSHIISDLTQAAELLPLQYVSGPKGRCTHDAAIALLAKVYLYRQQWSGAVDASSEVIDGGNYILETDLAHVFIANSQEAIWKIPPIQNAIETAEGYQFNPYISTIIPPYVINDYLLNAFEPGDHRRNEWISENIVSSVSYAFPYKYRLGYDGNSTPLEEYVFLRLSEQLLIRAEAYAHLGHITESLNDLNSVRNRAGLPGSLTNDPDILLKEIMHERQVELFCEWGNRWFDLKRTGTIHDVLSSEKPGWQDFDALYPIPLSEIHLDPFLTQNEGY